MLQKFAMFSFADTMLSFQTEAAHTVSKNFCDFNG